MPVTSVAKPPLGGIVRAQKVVVITGATSGVGRATARVFAERGWRIGVLARGEDGLKATAAEVEEFGGRALAIPTDVADVEQVERAGAQIEAELGGMDVWINDAMTSVFAPFVQITPEEYERATGAADLPARGRRARDRMGRRPSASS